ncbi:hypothetical protein Zmor_025078 [Zophobas morio]|uniref:Uncharacterized protein n=1 Tax=Zophobas morio TaxID=2755281 RepID=A0AA38M3E1_9CUCU|nr:hypothetical protein Zmor_025078 [Zophobas morio]
MKWLHTVSTLVFLVLIFNVNGLPAPFLKLFGAEDYYYPSQSRPRNHGRSYGFNEGGNRRYKAICRIHAVDSLAFPGRVGKPICPY